MMRFFKDDHRSERQPLGFKIKVVGEVEHPGWIDCESGATLRTVLMAAKVKAESWGPLEVCVTRERTIYSLSPALPKYGKERIYFRDGVHVRRQECWSWLDASRLGVQPIGFFQLWEQDD